MNTSFKNMLKIDTNDLNSCCEKQPSVMSYIAEQYKKAITDCEKAELDLEVIRAKVYNGARESIISAGEKIVESHLEKVVKYDDAVLAQQQIVIDKKAEYEYLKLIVKACEHRKDMLVQLCASDRKEYSSYTSIHKDYDSMAITPGEEI